MWKIFNEVFDCLPLAAVVNRKFMIRKDHTFACMEDSHPIFILLTRSRTSTVYAKSPPQVPSETLSGQTLSRSKTGRSEAEELAGCSVGEWLTSSSSTTG